MNSHRLRYLEMSRNNSEFKFKQFSVSHHRSSIKVGVDGVLIGCWTDTMTARKILDVGTGCGLIALMMAQRFPDAKVTGIEIDEASANEAQENVINSPWSDRINIIRGNFPSELNGNLELKYDLIVSNPPFFNSGVTDPVTSRQRARHQGSLSPSSLLTSSKDLLVDDGSLAMIVPSEMSSSLESEAFFLGYSLTRKCLVRGHKDSPYKRVLLQWRNGTCMIPFKEDETRYLTMEETRGIPTEEYRRLCKDFYLRF